MSAKVIFHNNIPIISEFHSSSKSAYFGVVFKTGSVDENKDISGVTHLIEHLSFKGTDNYDAKEFVNKVEKSGGYVNAYTTKEYTVFYMKSFYESFYELINMLFELCFKQRFEYREFTKEKKVIINEIESIYDNPEEMLSEEIEKELFAGTTLSMPIAGSVDSVKRMRLRDTKKYFKEKMLRNGIFITLIGNYDINIIFDMIDKYFDSAVEDRIEYENIILNKFEKNYHTNHSQAYLGYVVPAFSCNDSRKYELLALSQLVGETMSSKLFQALREDKSLCYNIESDVSIYSGGGYFAVYADVAQHNYKIFESSLFKEIDNIRSQSFSTSDLELAVNQLKLSTVSLFENMESKFGLYVRNYFYYSRIPDLEGLIKRLDKITCDSLNEMREFIFNKEFSICRMLK